MSDERTGYLLALGAAACAGLNGSLGRYLLDDGLSVWRLTQMRTTLAFLLVAAVLVVVDRRRLRLRLADLPAMVPLAVLMALAQSAYFFATTRMPIALALLVQYLYPLLLLAWLRLGHARRLPMSLWGAVTLTLCGTVLALGGVGPSHVDGIGLLAAVGSAVAFATYVVGSERIGDHHDATTTLVWTFLIASVLWALVQPVWTFPTARFDHDGNVAIGLAVAVVGTVVPFGCIMAAVRRVPATRASAALTAEAVFGGVFAYVLHDERLTAIQLAGAAVVLVSVAWLQLQPVDVEAERAPRKRPVTPAGLARPDPDAAVEAEP